MADSDKNILISPQRGSSTDSPSITLTGDGNDPISIYALDGTVGALSFEASTGQLFSITNNLTSGSIFSVNDVSGIPSIDVNSSGTVQIAPFGGAVALGQTTVTTGTVFDVKGDVRIDGDLSITSTTLVSNLNADLLDGQQGSYYTGYTDTAIANLIDSSPGTLDTLNELAAALGDDANFSTTITNSIATKLPKSGGQMTGNITFSGSQTVDGRDLSADGSKLDGIEASATADQTAAEILTAIKTVDGSGSGLDADTLDDVQASSFLRSDAADTATGTLTVRDIKFAAGYHLQRSDHHSGHLEGSYNNVGANSYNTNPIYTIGSGYNPASTTLGNMYGIGYSNANASFISGTGFSGWGMYVAADGDARVYLSGSNGTVASTGQHYVGSNVVWNAGNDGSGSGLDADLLDGQQGSYYLNYNNFSNTPTIPTNNNQLTNGAGYVTSNTQLSNEQVQDIVGGMVSSNTESGITVTYEDSDGTIDFSVASQTDNNFTTTLKNKLDGIESGATSDQTAAEILTAIKTVDGSGSGLDADTLDGVQGSNYLRSDTSDTMAGALTISGSTSRGSYTSASQYETGADNIVLKGNSVGRSGIFFESEKDGTNINHTSDFGFIQFHAYGTGSSGESNELIVGVSNDSDDHVILNAPSSTGLKFRTGNSATDYTIWHAGNDGSGSGLDADQLDGQHGSYYTGYTDTAIANLVDSSPGTLDTLNELAAALGDDASFSTTVTNSIATKLPKSGGQMTGNITFSGSQTVDGRDVSADGTKLDGIESNATADQTAAQILTAIKTVDGAGSGLDADTVDGIDSTSFLRSDAADIKTSGNLTFNNNVRANFGTNNDLEIYHSSANGTIKNNTGSLYLRTYSDNERVHIQSDNGSGGITDYFLANGSTGEAILYHYGAEKLATKSTGVTVTGTLTATSFSGSGASLTAVDADTLDGIGSGSFLRSDANDTVSGNISFTSTTTPITTNSIKFNNTEMSSSYYTNAVGVLAFDENFDTDTEYGTGTYDPNTVFTGGDGGGLLIKNEDGWGAIFTTQNTRWASAQWANLKVDTNQVWHAGNDGSGSGLDADLLDGQQGSYYLNYNNFTNTPTIPTNNNQLTNGAGFITSADGGNAATLDNIDSTSFLRSDAADQKTSGTLRFNDTVILALGSSDDAELFCNGSHLYLDLNSGIGNFYIRDGTTTRFTFDDNGDFTASGNVTAYSDITLKKNIEVIPNALDKVMQLRGITFDRKDIETSRQSGVIAQEVEKVLPEVVATNDEGIKSVAYGNLVGLLIEAIKDLKNEVDELKNKL